MNGIKCGIKKKVKIAKQNANIIENSLWLYFLQIFNTVIPLITLPYITRVLGASQYGAFSSALNIIGYFQVIVEYGFNLTGSRQVALAKNKNEIRVIYSRIFFSKCFLLLISGIGIFLCSIILGFSTEQKICLTILYMVIIGVAFQQTWLFQGMGVLKNISIIGIIGKSVSVILIFLFIRNDEQIYLYCFLYALTFLIMGFLSILFAGKVYKIYLCRIKINDIKKELKDGWYLFTTSAMTQIFSNIGITVLTLTSNPDIVGSYSAIQKIPQVLSMIFYPISQVIFPLLSKKYSESFKTGVKYTKKAMLLTMPIFCFLGLVIILSSSFIVNLLFGAEYLKYSAILIPLILWFIFSILNNFLGIQILVAGGYSREYSIAFKIGVIAIIVCNLLFGYLLGVWGVAFAALTSEFVLTISIIMQIKKVKNREKI